MVYNIKIGLKKRKLQLILYIHLQIGKWNLSKLNSVTACFFIIL
jgi:hypothetical protein